MHNGDRSPSVSIRDVGRAAGVSYQTVSRVINESPGVKDSTRSAVLEAIERLGFRPNRAARALAGGPVQSVTVLVSNTSLYGFRAGLEGIEEATREAGFGMGVRVVESDAPADVREAVERSLEPAGALIVIAFDRPGVVALECVPPDVPVAAMIPTPSETKLPRRPSVSTPVRALVWIDEFQAAKEATGYLLALGHKVVHHLSIPNWTGTSRRMEGWRAALADAGVRAPKPLQGGWGADWGYEAGQQVARKSNVTAVLCGNDDIALGVMRAMYEAGRSVPDDVSIVGFDDEPYAKFLTPALTTVRQDFKTLGKVCFTKLLALVGPGRPGEEVEYPQAVFVIRESAAPPPGVVAQSSRERLAAQAVNGQREGGARLSNKSAGA
jgi:DNA-binding LacI/PurR family transcriptional regulator